MNANKRSLATVIALWVALLCVPFWAALAHNPSGQLMMPPPLVLSAQPMPETKPVSPAPSAEKPPTQPNHNAQPPTTIPPARRTNGLEGLTFKEVPRDAYLAGTITDVQVRQGKDAAGNTVDLTTYVVSVTATSDASIPDTVTAYAADSAAKTAYSTGNRVTLMRTMTDTGDTVFVVTGRDRHRMLAVLALAFFVFAICLGGIRAATSLAGLASTIGVILGFVVPKVMQGADPFGTCVIAACVIALLSLFLGHGLNRRTVIAFFGTIVSLCVLAALSVLTVQTLALTGMTSADASLLKSQLAVPIDFQGMLLGGIVLGALGMLDDVTTGQAAIVEELKHANPNLGFRELYRRGTSVGREHIASLINTLFLAYAGTSLSMFLLFDTGTAQPLWYVLSSESIAAEIVRTIVGSAGLVLAVPLTTAMAAAYYAGHVVPKGETMVDGAHHHHHHH